MSKLMQSQNTGQKNINAVITPDVYRLLMDILSPVPVNHKSDYRDMIKNVILSELRGKINAIYNKGSY
jgi:hypothetical protein